MNFAKLGIVTSIIVQASAASAMTNYLETQFKNGECLGRWHWTNRWTEPVPHPAEYKNVERGHVESRDKITTEIITKTQGFGCVNGGPTHLRCEPEIVLRQKCTSWVESQKALLIPGQYASHDLGPISERKASGGGDVADSYISTATCSLKHYGLTQDKVWVVDGVDKVLIKEAWIEYVEHESEGQSAIGDNLSDVRQETGGVKREGFECSSADHIAINKKSFVLDKYYYLSRKLDEFDDLVPNPTTCSPNQDENCREIIGIITNYLALASEDTQKFLPIEAQSAIMIRYNAKYLGIGHPEHLQDSVPNP